MKTSFFLTTFCLISLGAFIVYSKIAEGSGPSYNTSVTISESKNDYSLTASYDVRKTAKVQSYINDAIAPNSLFRSENDDFNVTTTLADRTNFHVKESPGKLKIEIDKKQNSYASYRKVKKMCEGIKDLLCKN